MQDTRYMDDWIQVPLCQKGEKLYHYTTAEGVRGIVENREFMATKSDFLNDKLEFQYAMEVVERLAETYIVNEGLRERFFSMLKEEVGYLGIVTPVCEEACVRNDMNFYVISFSKLQNNALLWAEFTDFRGYCLEFDYETLVAGFQHRLFLHGTVIYNEEKQMDALRESLLTCIYHLEEDGKAKLSGFFEEDAEVSDESLEQLVSIMAVVVSVYAMFFKKSCFEGEEEYRFVINELGERKSKFRLLDQIFLPYIMVEFDRDMEKIPLESVMVGAKNNSDIVVRGMRYFLHSQDLDVPVLLSDIPLRY